MCRRTPLSWKESFDPGTVPVLRAQEGSGGAGTMPCLRSPCAEFGLDSRAFVSKSNSYKAWIGSEEAKQTRLKSEGDQVSG